MIPPSQGTPRAMDLTYCTIKNGVNDLLDYIALTVALIIPLILGPGVIGLFQVGYTLNKTVHLGKRTRRL
jgi:hypothetical protein